MIQAELKKAKWRNANIKHVVLGDINATHTAWGLPVDSERNDITVKLGLQWFEQFNRFGYDIHNDGKPTRFQCRNGVYKYSWLDVVAAKNIDPRRIKSNTIQLDFGSDHHCMITDINTVLFYNTALGKRANWHIPENTNWKMFTEYLSAEWDRCRAELAQFSDEDNMQHQVDSIHALVLQCYNNTANHFFRLQRYKKKHILYKK